MQRATGGLSYFTRSGEVFSRRAGEGVFQRVAGWRGDRPLSHGELSRRGARFAMSHSSLPGVLSCLWDGSDLMLAPSRRTPFYLFWSPDDRFVAWLGTAGQMGLEVVDYGAPEDRFESTLVLEGAPCFFNWAPDSRRIAAISRSGARMHIADLANGSASLQLTALSFVCATKQDEKRKKKHL